MNQNKLLHDAKYHGAAKRNEMLYMEVLNITQ